MTCDDLIVAAIALAALYSRERRWKEAKQVLAQAKAGTILSMCPCIDPLASVRNSHLVTRKLSRLLNGLRFERCVFVCLFVVLCIATCGMLSVRVPVYL